MEEVAYEQFRRLESSHWWFLGRRRIFFTILDEGLPAKEGGLRILDAGCGSGEMFEGLARLGRPVGLDPSARALADCRARGWGEVVRADGLHLPFAAASFDFVTFFDALEHLDDDKGALAEGARVLKPGGWMFATVPSYQFLYSDNDRISHHVRRYTGRELARGMERAGIDVVRATYYNALLFPAILVALLAARAKQALFPVPRERMRDNLHVRFPALANRAFTGLLDLEARWLRHRHFPFGHSLVCLGRKA